MASTLLAALAGDEAIERLFADETEIDGMIAFEAALAHVEAELGVIPLDAADRIEAVCGDFRPPFDRLRDGMQRDGVVGPSFVAALKEAVGEPDSRFVHFGATSQDVVDTALVLRLARLVDVLDRRLLGLIEALTALRERDGATALMAQTRMQRALPFTAGDKLDTWIRPLQRDRERLAELRPRLLVVQFGGPVGTRSGLSGKGDAIAVRLAERLGLAAAPPWHTARDGIAEFGGWLSLVTGTLGKIGADVALMAQNKITAVRLAGGGSSSAMPHKSNPVVAEVLVALARYNAGLIGTLHQALVHENERSGAAWTLEWLVLPQMAITAGAALRHADRLVAALRFVGEAGAGQ